MNPFDFDRPPIIEDLTEDDWSSLLPEHLQTSEFQHCVVRYLQIIYLINLKHYSNQIDPDYPDGVPDEYAAMNEADRLSDELYEKYEIRAERTQSKSFRNPLNASELGSTSIKSSALNELVSYYCDPDMTPGLNKTQLAFVLGFFTTSSEGKRKINTSAVSASNSKKISAIFEYFSRGKSTAKIPYKILVAYTTDVSKKPQTRDSLAKKANWITTNKYQ